MTKESVMTQGGMDQERQTSMSQQNLEERKETANLLNQQPFPKKSAATLTDPQSRLSFIYDEVTQRMKNIEDFGAPLSQLDRILHSILVQMRTNVNEPDHPINVIINKFTEIILQNVEQIKYKFRFSANLTLPTNLAFPQRGRALSKPEVEINRTTNLGDDNIFEDEAELLRGPTVQQHHTSFKMPDKQARQTALLGNRGTYNRQTLNNLPQEAKFAEIVIAEIKKLVCMLYGTLVRFYIPVMRYEDLHEMREDLIELLTSVTVKGELSKLVLQLCRLGTKDDEVMLAQKFQELKTIKTENIGIDRLFTLNESSKLLELFSEQEEKIKKGSIEGDVGGSKVQCDGDSPPKGGIAKSVLIQTPGLSQETSEKSPPFDRQIASKSLLLPIQEIIGGVQTEENERKESMITQQIPLTKEFIKLKLAIKPYILAIHNLRRIREYDTPIDKMRCITQTSKFIVHSIDLFWKDVTQIDKKKLTLDADQLLMIFIFVTIRAKIYELLAHLKFINEFSTNTLRLSKLGYCILTLEVALQQIISLDQQVLLSKSTISITNAKELLEQSLQQSLQSEYPFMIKDDVFELVDEYDNTIERSFQVDDKDEKRLKGTGLEQLHKDLAPVKQGKGRATYKDEDPMSRMLLLSDQ